VRASKLAWTAKNRERVNEQQRLRRPRYRARTTAWNARNRARINQQQRARYYRNRARRLLMARARYERRRAHFLAACRRYRQQNQARVKATCAGWHRRHPESHRKSVNNYNFRRRTRGLPPDAIEMRRVLLALRRWLKAHQLRLADFT
jgi:hypothetical protein